jgi:hypothetical protein
MKLSSVFITALSTIAVTATTALGFSGQAQALTFSGISSGTWGEPDLECKNTPRVLEPFCTGVNTNSFTWGDASYYQDKRPNQLTFSGNSFSANKDSLFKIGDLTYFNGTVALGTNVNSVPLKLHVSFNNSVDVSEVFNFNFHLVNTPNESKNPEDNADFVYVKNNFDDGSVKGKGIRSFSVDGIKYTLELTGFRQGNSATNVSEFRVLEEKTTTAGIFARITQVPEPKKVAEPGFIAGLSMLGIYLISRKKSLKS